MCLYSPVPVYICAELVPKFKQRGKSARTASLLSNLYESLLIKKKELKFFLNKRKKLMYELSLWIGTKIKRGERVPLPLCVVKAIKWVSHSWQSYEIELYYKTFKSLFLNSIIQIIQRNWNFLGQRIRMKMKKSTPTSNLNLKLSFYLIIKDCWERNFV